METELKGRQELAQGFIHNETMVAYALSALKLAVGG